MTSNIQHIDTIDLGNLFVDERYLQSLNHDHELILVAFGMTHPAGINMIRQLWGRFDKKEKAIGRDETKSIRIDPTMLGGAVTLIDLNLQGGRDAKLIADLSITNPMGLHYYDKTGELFVAGPWDIKKLKKGRIQGSLNNNLFNTIHTIKSSGRGIYVVCTGMDAILEIDPANPSQNLWEWLAIEHGFSRDRFGRVRLIDRNINYQHLDVGGTRAHTTHVNGVEKLDKDNVLATLFHQDCLIKIDKRTGNSEVIYDKLTNPHSINRTKNGFMVSDTRGGRVVFFDHELNFSHQLEGEFDWVQESIEFGDYFLIGNDNHGKIDIYSNDLRYLHSVEWGKDYRKLSAIIKISAADAIKIFLK